MTRLPTKSGFRMLCYGSLLLMVLFADAFGGEQKAAKPNPKDKCPVCGMFVAKYPDFLAQIRFQDRSTAFFDGVKDMFKFYFNLHRYAPNQKASDIDSVFVTDYYSLTPVDGQKAFYVAGSDVFGPMGKELIPFEREGDAREFLKDHKGKRIVPFRDVTPELIKSLD